ncbi:MAG: hypothetical protein EA417_02160, partial [Gammaproteobacteria bacterium]
EAARGNTGGSVTATGRDAARNNTGNNGTFLGYEAGRDNTRNDLLVIRADTGTLLQGRFRSNTDPDAFAYTKGLHVDGILEAAEYIVLTSPNGTRWKIEVDNSGNLTTSDASVGEIIP